MNEVFDHVMTLNFGSKVEPCGRSLGYFSPQIPQIFLFGREHARNSDSFFSGSK